MWEEYALGRGLYSALPNCGPSKTHFLRVPICNSHGDWATIGYIPETDRVSKLAAGCRRSRVHGGRPSFLCCKASLRRWMERLCARAQRIEEALQYNPVWEESLSTMLGHTPRTPAPHPTPHSFYIFITPNGVSVPRPIFTGTSAVPRCPADCPALSRAFPRPIFTGTSAVPRCPADCPALSRGPFLPAHLLSCAVP